MSFCCIAKAKPYKWAKFVFHTHVIKSINAFVRFYFTLSCDESMR